jgi:hypothetical protein
MRRILLLLCVVCHVVACTKTTKPVKTEEIAIYVPSFSPDSAYHYIQKQVDFGPRVPNTEAQLKCAAYLSSTLERFGAKVIEQRSFVTAFDGTQLRNINIIGSYSLEATTRILLFAHWDSRPWADNDPNPLNHTKAVTGANDGASGVGVLLEIARQLQLRTPKVGVDIIFFDTEDYGTTNPISGQEDSWCLGTQYWAKNPHIAGYRAKYGILLDMVGAPNATFYREQISDYYAPQLVTKVWSQAKSLGFGHYFIDAKGGTITDDHYYVNKIAGIPSINIIQYDPNGSTGFGSYWHTIDDTMKNIDKSTLNAVGLTVLHVVHTEQ